MIRINSPKFPSGQLLATPGALDALAEAKQTVHDLLIRHLQGDWGDLDEEDRQLNDEAIRNGSRILSAYILTTGRKVWLITEAADESGQRVATTALLPEEY